MKDMKECEAAIIADEEKKCDRMAKLSEIFESIGFDTSADMWEVETFIEDLYIQLNSDSFTRLWSIIFDKKVNGEL